MEGGVQWNPVYSCNDFRLLRVSYPGAFGHQAAFNLLCKRSSSYNIKQSCQSRADLLRNAFVYEEDQKHRYGSILLTHLVHHFTLLISGYFLQVRCGDLTLAAM